MNIIDTTSQIRLDELTKIQNIGTNIFFNDVSGIVDTKLGLHINHGIDMQVAIKNKYVKFGNDVIDLHGVELCKGGVVTSDKDLTYWNTLNATVSHTKLGLQVSDATNLGSNSQAFQDIPTKIGATYIATIDTMISDGLNNAQFLIGDKKLITKEEIFKGVLVFVATSDLTRCKCLIDSNGTATFNNISVREIKGLDLKSQIINTNAIGANEFINNHIITGNDVAKDTQIGDVLDIPTSTTGEQIKVSCRIFLTTNGCEIQILDKSDDNKVFRTQSLDSHESDDTFIFWLPENSDGYTLKAIKRVNDGSGDEKIEIQASTATPLVTTKELKKGDYVITDTRNQIVNGTFDIDANENEVVGWTNHNSKISSTNRVLKVDDSDDSGSWSSARCNVKVKPYTNYVVSLNILGSVGNNFSVASGADFDGNYGDLYVSDYDVPKGSHTFEFNSKNNTIVTLAIGVDGDKTTYFSDVVLHTRDMRFRALEDINIGTDISSPKFEKKDYVSNQYLLLLKCDKYKNITLVDDLAVKTCDEYDANLDRDAVAINNGYLRVSDGLFKKDEDLYLLLGVTQTLNKGIYHPIYNQMGCNVAGRYGSVTYSAYARQWISSEVSFLDVNNVYEYFNEDRITITEKYMGKKGCVLDDNYMRPDVEFYDVMYRNRFIPLFTSCESYTNDLKEESDDAYYSGKTGVCGLPATIAISNIGYSDSNAYNQNGFLLYVATGTDDYKIIYKNKSMNIPDKMLYISNVDGFVILIRKDDGKYKRLFTSSTAGDYGLPWNKNTMLGVTGKLISYCDILSNEYTTTTDIICNPLPYTSGDALDDLQSSSTDTNSDLRQYALSWNVDENRMYRYRDTDDRDDVDLTKEDYTDDSKWEYITRGYPEAWKLYADSFQRVVGCDFNLINKNTNVPIVPDTHSYEYVLLYKAISNGLYRLYNGHGVAVKPTKFFSKSGLGISPENSESSGSTDVIFGLYSYNKANNPMIVSDIKAINFTSNMSRASCGNSLFDGALLTNLITDGIATEHGEDVFKTTRLNDSTLNKMKDLFLHPLNLYYGKAYPSRSFLYDGVFYKYIGVTVSNIKNWWTDLPYSAGWTKTTGLRNNPTNEIINILQTSAKASKSFFGTAKDKHGIYDVIMGQELVNDSGYNSSRYSIGNGITTDDKSHSVRTKFLMRQTQFKR